MQYSEQGESSTYRTCEVLEENEDKRGKWYEVRIDGKIFSVSEQDIILYLKGMGLVRASTLQN